MLIGRFESVAMNFQPAHSSRFYITLAIVMRIRRIAWKNHHDDQCGYEDDCDEYEDDEDDINYNSDLEYNGCLIKYLWGWLITMRRTFLAIFIKIQLLPDKFTQQVLPTSMMRTTLIRKVHLTSASLSNFQDCEDCDYEEDGEDHIISDFNGCHHQSCLISSLSKCFHQLPFSDANHSLW